MRLDQYIAYLMSNPANSSCVNASDVLQVSHDEANLLLLASDYTAKDRFDSVLPTPLLRLIPIPPKLVFLHVGLEFARAGKAREHPVAAVFRLHLNLLYVSLGGKLLHIPQDVREVDAVIRRHD